MSSINTQLLDNDMARKLTQEHTPARSPCSTRSLQLTRGGGQGTVSESNVLDLLNQITTIHRPIEARNNGCSLDFTLRCARLL